MFSVTNLLVSRVLVHRCCSLPRAVNAHVMTVNRPIQAISWAVYAVQAAPFVAYDYIIIAPGKCPLEELIGLQFGQGDVMYNFMELHFI